MNLNAEAIVEAGVALTQLGRHLQRTFPVPSIVGSQFEEDQILAELLPQKHGIYVDVGAHHFCDCSNSWNFYQTGWRGLLIEPLPDAWPNLLLHRSEDFLFPGAASDLDGFANLRVCRNISSLRDDWPNDATETVPVLTDTLAGILKRYPGVNWGDTNLCSIDVEGHEREVLLGIDWETFHPEVFCIEFTDMAGKDTSGPWRYILERNGYRVAGQTQLNQIWTRI